ncbi:hypothetical protein V1J52_10580 [Streptomyces sp. TRM 70351]|uniref:hypothetical protein n=1 Tax=Streptomyces sp. TRM 70351 TaxID=3116552 RepID=UPI002E7B4041|nr:hypothetical protein [Streptomyces sp. TRM 70351]MEE1928634.1 hypothetical protein [Streptomyces sp. TRM 70351]
MQPPRTLDDLLNDARAFPHDHPGAEEGRASRHRLEDAAAEAVARGAARGGPPPPAALPRRERAARELRQLSYWAVHGPGAAQLIAALAATHQIDPDGALVFACLLHLADRDEQAEFLWQFAAGAGKPAAAECLYLLHLTRGELRHARHWARQAADLDTADSAPRCERRPARPPAARREPRPLTSLMLLRTWRALRRHETAGSWTAGTFHTRTGTLSRALAHAVQSLKGDPDPDTSLLPWPDPTLARHLGHHPAL